MGGGSDFSRSACLLLSYYLPLAPCAPRPCPCFGLRLRDLHFYLGPPPCQEHCQVRVLGISGTASAPVDCKPLKEARASTQDSLGSLLLGQRVLGPQGKPQQPASVELLLCSGPGLGLPVCDGQNSPNNMNM